MKVKPYALIRQLCIGHIIAIQDVTPKAVAIAERIARSV